MREFGLSARLMSALGQKQTCAVHKRMSAFTPESGHVQCNSVCPLCANSGHPDHLLSSACEKALGYWQVAVLRDDGHKLPLLESGKLLDV